MLKCVKSLYLQFPDVRCVKSVRYEKVFFCSIFLLYSMADCLCDGFLYRAYMDGIPWIAFTIYSMVKFFPNFKYFLLYSITYGFIIFSALSYTTKVYQFLGFSDFIFCCWWFFGFLYSRKYLIVSLYTDSILTFS